MHALTEDSHAHARAVRPEVKEVKQLLDEAELLLEVDAPDAAGTVQEEVDVCWLTSATWSTPRVHMFF